MNPNQLWDEVQRLFTLVAQIDSEGTLVRASPLLNRKCRLNDTGPIKFFDYFKFKRPTLFDGSLASAREAIGELFLGFSEESGFAIRGQVLDYSDMGLEGLCFVGVPWLWWIEENTADSNLTMSDFPVHDVQMDQLFFMSTQQSMVEDLQALNVQLKSAKQDVERANEARQKYFHHVSHEMRTSLNGVISAISLMGDFKLDGKLREYSSLASKSADRLLEVINFTLETASLESHMDEADNEPFRLDNLVDECLLLARSRSLEKGLELRRSGQRAFTKIYTGRLKLLRQVLGNLLSNAVKFSDSGVITLGASTVRSSGRKEDLIEFAVTDRGPGIPADVIDKLFDPFTTGLSLETQHSQGTGLGLSIVKRFVEAMGGDVRVESSVGQGTIFCVTIPLSLAAQGDPLACHGDITPAAFDEFSGAVLLIQDHKISRQLNQKLLESLGLSVIMTGSGEEGARLIGSDCGEFDLIVIDTQVQDLDAYEAALRICEIPGAVAIPILALADHVDPRDRLNTEQASIVEVLAEPLSVENLRTALLAHLPATAVVSRADLTGDLTSSREAPENLESVLPGEEGAILDKEIQGMTESNKPNVCDDDSLPRDDIAFDSRPIDRLVREVGIGVLDTLVEKFLGESTDRWESLRKAMADQERNIIIREAHTLGSACLTFGLSAAGGSFRQVEASALAGGVLPTEDPLPAISEQLRHGITELQHLLSEQRSK
jgi:signal transduction histidine kinase/CheY-like chemotaxis protein/HPt (histidine-containing phosphotransfer) domain-containing protein